MADRNKILKILWYFSLIFFLLANKTHSAALNFVKDTISDSAPGVNADHNIQFTLVNSVPASGKIIIAPQPGAFAIPLNLDYTDIDFLVNDAESAIGVSVTAGISGNITFTLNNTDALAAGSVITIKINNQQIQNPASAGSYKINIKTYNYSNELIDQANAMVAVVSAIEVGAGKEAEVEIEAEAPAAEAPTLIKDGGMIMGITPAVTEAKAPISLEQIIDGIRQKIIMLMQQIIILANNQINILREQIQQLAAPPASPAKTTPSAEVKELKSVESESGEPTEQQEEPTIAPIITPRVLIAVSVLIGILALLFLVK